MKHPETEILIADFETTTDPEDCRVWAACAVELQTNNVEIITNSLSAFIDFLSERNTIVYFHNLAFDGMFIIDFLLKNGYKYTSRKENKTFDCLISDTGAFYSINIRFKKSGKYWYRANIRDSLKKINAKVERIAKAYNLPYEKLHIDYNEQREIGHELTEEEREYIVADCKIVAAALKTHINDGLDRVTAASDAFNIYKTKYIGIKNFEFFFPVLPLEIDKDIRKSYRGGFTYLNPRYANVQNLQGIVLDVNSEYPYILHEKPMPVRYPIYFEGVPKKDDHFPLFVARCRFAFELKPGRIPAIQIKNSFRFKQNEYLTTSNGEIVELFLTNIDLKLIFEQYDVFNFEIINGWKFQAKQGLFTKYIDHFYELKKNSTGALREVAKIMQNSLYGKFGMNPEKIKKVPFILNDIVKFKMDDPEIVDSIYTPLATFVTSYGRDLIIRAAQANYDRFIYSDTDSIHLIGHELPDGLRVDPKELGAFKIEESFIDSLYIRQKTYMHTTEDGNITVKCAGMPDSCKRLVTYDNFHVGSKFPGKLIPKVVPGGVVLQETFFTIT